MAHHFMIRKKSPKDVYNKSPEGQVTSRRQLISQLTFKSADCGAKAYPQPIKLELDLTNQLMLVDYLGNKLLML